MADKHAETMLDQAARIADALEHGLVQDDPSKELMLDSHRDECPVCAPRRAEIMKEAAAKAEAKAAEDAAKVEAADRARLAAEKVNEYGKPEPPEPEEEPDPSKPVEVGR